MLDENVIQETIDENMNRNEELLEVLAEAKVDPNASCVIEFHYCAWSQEDATNLKNALIKSGAKVEEDSAVEEDDVEVWTLTAELTVTPASAASLELTDANARLAAEFDCIYDGWGMCI